MDNVNVLHNGVFRMAISDTFTFSDHEAFREVLQQMRSLDVNQVVINLAAATFVDSAAMGMLLLARDEALKHGKGLVLEAAVGQVRKMFDMANFKNLFVLQ